MHALIGNTRKKKSNYIITVLINAIILRLQALPKIQTSQHHVLVFKKKAMFNSLFGVSKLYFYVFIACFSILHTKLKSLLPICIFPRNLNISKTQNFNLYQKAKISVFQTINFSQFNNSNAGELLHGIYIPVHASLARNSNPVLISRYKTPRSIYLRIECFFL